MLAIERRLLMPVIDMEARPVSDTWIDGALDHRIAAEPLVVPIATLVVLSPGEVEEARPIGVRVTPGAEIERLFAMVDHLDLIVIEFPSFRDGRGFTLATTLRGRHRFTGDLRASGQVLPDQFAALCACGFSTIETSASHPPEQWQRALAATGATDRSAGPLLKRLLTRSDTAQQEMLHLPTEAGEPG
ncbi:DUF934 domain-containing protein [Sphingomonas sp. H39-1-10]|uniref:DUF934 domain-containing protein n=1 Tax=Sphingomonadales TaxID=204457 RepID=UPI000C20ACC2|nr:MULTISPECIES: DUF934 domain-containing protein [Sphingomonadaceae]MDF0490116.1 DUF934 domain-containing protein [Sphingomonas pollutisoli]PJG45464.1 hypothetical protein CAF53_22225 [Sphingobium sp. LB126]